MFGTPLMEHPQAETVIAAIEDVINQIQVLFLSFIFAFFFFFGFSKFLGSISRKTRFTCSVLFLVKVDLNKFFLAKNNFPGKFSLAFFLRPKLAGAERRKQEKTRKQIIWYLKESF